MSVPICRTNSENRAHSLEASNGSILGVLAALDGSSTVTIAAALVELLSHLGVKYAFGVSGGAIGPIWAELEASPIKVLHFRHEVGAGFAATEAYFASGDPVAVFATTGPGITNALTGLFAAKWEGAKVIFLSGATTVGKQGTWALQETSSHTMPMEGLFTSGKLFDYATILNSSEQLPGIAHRLAAGLTQVGGFVAHLNIPTAVQTAWVDQPSHARVSASPVTVSEHRVQELAQLLAVAPFAIWVGFGARHAVSEIRQLAERTGAAVMCSPRAKGIFPEDHPQFVGVTGLGGHTSVFTYMQKVRPLRTLVLGTRLGEFTSFGNPAMVPDKGFIHVDICPDVPGAAYPTAETIAVQADVKLFLQSLLQHFPDASHPVTFPALPLPQIERVAPMETSSVRPDVLFDAIQTIIVEGSDALVMADVGNTMAWTANRLSFKQPDRYRASLLWASMGHFATGIIGAALARRGKAVVIVGDGAMLMNNEVSTAVKHHIPAVWIVANDSSYNMCEKGMCLLGLKGVDTTIPHTNFAQLATAMGAEGIRVENEADLYAALEKAMAATAPVVVDVVIDAKQIAPIGGRIASLTSQGAINPGGLAENT